MQGDVFAGQLPPHYDAPMRWVLHGALSDAAAAAVAEALQRHGDQVALSAELQLAPDANAWDVLKAAQSRQWDVITSDAALIHAIFEQKIWFNRAIVYLQLQGADIEQADAIDRLYARYKRLSAGRLYTVTASRVKVRQLPARV